MSSGDTRALIVSAVEGVVREVPALAKLTLVARVELRAHGGDPIWRVEVPGPKVTRDPAGDARIDVSIGRPEFNELAKEGRLRGLGMSPAAPGRRRGVDRGKEAASRVLGRLGRV